MRVVVSALRKEFRAQNLGFVPLVGVLPGDVAAHLYRVGVSRYDNDFNPHLYGFAVDFTHQRHGFDLYSEHVRIFESVVDVVSRRLCLPLATCDHALHVEVENWIYHFQAQTLSLSLADALALYSKWYGPTAAPIRARRSASLLFNSISK